MSSFGSWSSWGYDEPDWDSEYDSTWEDDEDHKLLKQANPRKKFWQHSRGSRAAQDLQHYRHGYPESMLNLKFYRNEIPFEPSGVLIDDLHKYWKFDYNRLESNHNFIQWLFPLREPGMNTRAIPLTEKELEEMKKDKDVMKRFLESYKLMLGFYGIELVDPVTGEVDLAQNWNKRFSNLDAHTHNNLRITRILKCLGELGYERYQVPLVKFFLKETLCHGSLQNVKKSALNYFMFTVKNKSERKKLVLFAWEHYEPKEKFTWGPIETLRKLKPPAPMENPDNEDMKEEQESPMESESVDNKEKEGAPMDSPVESRSEADKETEETPTESKEVNENGGSQMEPESEDKKKGVPPMKSRLNDDIEKSGSPTEFGSEDKANGKQPMQYGAANDKDNKGPPMQSQENKRAPMDSTSDNEKENKKPPTDSGSEDDQENGAQSMQPGAVDDKSNTLPPTNESENVKDNKETPRVSGFEEEKNREQQMLSGSTDDKDNKGTLTDCLSGDTTEKGGSLIKAKSEVEEEIRRSSRGSGSEDKNREQPMPSRSTDDKNTGGPPMECESGVSEVNKNKEQPMPSRSTDDKNTGGPPMECESGVSEDDKNREQPMPLRSTDGKNTGGPPMECESGVSEDDKNKGQPMPLRSTDDKNTGGPPMERESGVSEVDKENQGLLEENKDNGRKPTECCSQYTEKNGETLTQSRLGDDRENKESPADSGTRDPL